MAQKIPEEIANELWKAVNRLEIATDIIKSWVTHMNSHLSPSEKLLVDRSKGFLGKNNES